MGGVNLKLAVIEINKADVQNSAQMKSFFNALSFAEEEIAENCYRGRCFDVQPIVDQSMETQLKSICIIKRAKVVYKLYNENTLPQELMQ